MSRFLIITASLGVLLCVTACSPGSSDGEDTPTEEPAPTSQAATPDPEPATFDVSGMLVMESPMAIGRSSDHEAGGMCMMLNQDLSFSDDHQLLLLDAGGDVVALGELGDFAFIEDEEANICAREFTINDVPEGTFFQLQFGDITSDVVDQDYLAGQDVTWTFS